MCSAETTRTPSGTISAACWAAEPCQTPSIRVALPDTAAASGTVASTTSCPSRRCSLRLVSVSDWLRNGTHRNTTSRARGRGPVGVGLEASRPGPPRAAWPPSPRRVRRRASRSRSGLPARPGAAPGRSPRAPEAPITVTASAMARKPKRRGAAARCAPSHYLVERAAHDPGRAAGDGAGRRRRRGALRRLDPAGRRCSSPCWVVRRPRLQLLRADLGVARDHGVLAAVRVPARVRGAGAAAGCTRHARRRWRSATPCCCSSPRSSGSSWVTVGERVPHRARADPGRLRGLRGARVAGGSGGSRGPS